MGDDGPDRRLAVHSGGDRAPLQVGVLPAGDAATAGFGRVAAIRDAGRRIAPRPRTLRLWHRADPAELRVVRERVARWAQQNGLPGDVVTDLQLALGEAVANGVEHAYRDGRTGNVEVELALRGRGRRATVAVRVADHGCWRPAPQVNGHRGRGLTMIRSLAAAVDVRPGDTGTTVCFEIPVRP